MNRQRRFFSVAPAVTHSFAQALSALSVPASHQSGTMRARRPLAYSLRTKMCGRAPSSRTSVSRSCAISETRKSQQQASRTITSFIRALGERRPRRSKSASTARSSERVSTLVGAIV